MTRPTAGRAFLVSLQLFAGMVASASWARAQGGDVRDQPPDSQGAAPADAIADAVPATERSAEAERTHEEGAEGASARESHEDEEPTGDDTELDFDPLAYVETFFLWSFREPSNGVVAYRGFDNRHASFTIANAALGGRLAYERVYAHVVLQWGHTPASYYAAETSVAAAAGTGASDAELWRALQQAYLGWNVPILERGLRIEGGLFLSPVGIEAMAVADNWNWSRSNLFFGLPFYHTGVRATVPIDAAWSVAVAGYNGWNTVLDNNDEKSVSASVSYSTGELAATLLYFGGVERGPGEPQRGWRNLFDLTARVSAASWLDLQAQLDVGFEPWSDATYVWVAAALYARVRPLSWLDLALRGDFFWDGAPADAAGARRSPIFWPAEWVSSATATVTFRPLPQLLFRVEYRHDEAASEMFFAGEVEQTPEGEPILDAVRQDTLTFGAVAQLQ